MRIKLIALATAVAALAIGYATSSQATLTTSTSATVKLAKAGAPAQAHIVIDNTDNEVVPERVASVSIASKTAKFNAKAVKQCTSPVPTNAAGNNNAAEIVPPCPSASKVGKGTATVTTGTVGQPIPSDLGTIVANVNIYNYKPSPGDQATLLLEIISNIPVQNGHVYEVAHVSKSGTISSNVPLVADLPPTIGSFFTGRTVTLSHLDTTIKSPKPKKGQKPFFTLKNLKNLDFNITLTRDHQQ